MDISAIELVLIGICAENIAFTFLNGSIFSEVRDILKKLYFFHSMLSCFLCTSFWTAVFSYFLFYYCPWGTTILGISVVHAFARYNNMFYVHLEVGTKTTLPMRKVTYE